MNNSDKISPGASHANGSVTMNEPSQGQSSGDLVNQNSTVPSLSNGEWPISQSQTHPVQQVPMNSNGNGNIPLSASAHAPSTTAINNNNINTSDSKLNDGGWFTSAVTATSTNSSNTPSYGNMTASYAQEKRVSLLSHKD